MMMRRVATAGASAPLRSAMLAGQKRFFTPKPDYIRLYKEPVEKGSYPVDIQSGVAPDFAKLMFRFAQELEGKKFDAYLKAFEDPKAAQPDGFQFVRTWMDAIHKGNELSSVENYFREMVDSATNTATVTATFASPADQQKHSAGILAAAEKKRKDSGISDGAKLKLRTMIDPDLQGGYTWDLGNVFVDASDRAKAIRGKENQVNVVDYSRAAPPVYRPTPVNSSSFGAAYRALAIVDEAEATYGF